MSKYTKRSDGRYQTRIYIGLNEYNKKQYKYLYAKSEKELRTLEAEYRSRVDRGIDIASANDTYCQWLERAKTIKEPELTDNEYNLFVSRASYFQQYIGDIQIKDIKPANIQVGINEVYAHNPSTGKLSAKRTVERYLSAVSSVFEYAIENRVTDFNPCKYVKIPKQAKTSERKALTVEQRRWVEETPHRAQLAAMLLMYSGLRRGEATALLWSDVDLKSKTITVSKSYDFKTCTLKTPKTNAGIRMVSIPDKLVAYLSAVPKNSIYVLTTAKGKMMTDTAWKRMWDSYMCDLNLKYGKSTIKRNKYNPLGNLFVIEPFTPHCLRHTFCTMMYEAGIDVLTAKEQMGHSDVKTTLSIYTHLDQTHKKKNVSKLDAYLDESIG